MVTLLFGRRDICTLLTLDEIASEQAMHHEVGITTYGRGEMCIALKAQPIMPNMRCRIASLRHGAYRKHRDHILLRLPLDVIEELIQTLGNRLCASLRMELIAHASNKLRETT